MSDNRLQSSRQEAIKLFDDSISAVITAFEQQRSYVTTPITVCSSGSGYRRVTYFVTADGIPHRWFWSE